MAHVGTIHFIRHGDTEASGDGVFCGDLDVPLAASGVVQAEGLARLVGRWTTDAIYVSPKLRARMTAEPVCRARGLAATVEEGLREIAYGRWEGRHEAEIRASEPDAYDGWSADPGSMSPPGGESGYTIAARAMPVVARILEAHGDGAVVVFSHKATIRIITCVLLGIPISRFRDRIACPTASITTFTFGAHGPLLTRLGETAG
jgi:probable phosphoglycerate mutase